MAPAFRRFSWEIGILALLLILGASAFFAYPFILGATAGRAHDADRQLLQDAVTGYRESSPAIHPWPTITGRPGVPAEGGIEGYQCDGSDATEVCSWLDYDLLVEDGGLATVDQVNSTETNLNVSATNAPGGSYGWYVTTDGTVASSPPFSREVGYP